jgi:beta-phosphoglucomutase-like phosphatase (HAD superfamily)
MMLLNKQTPAAFQATKVRAVIFDWAGTTIDFGSLAPVKTLQRVFAEAGIPITEEEARRDMGIAKRDHIAALLRVPRIQEDKMQVYPLGALIKVGDTESDIKEGLNAGVWSVGVAATGNGVGLSQSDFNKLDLSQRDPLIKKSRQQLAAAGAHFVIDTLAEFHLVIQQVDDQLNRKKPG